MRQTYSVPVVFLQLLLVDGPGAALAQDLNIQDRLQQMMPSPPVQTPDFNAGRLNQPNKKRADHTLPKAHHKQNKSQ